MRCKIRQFYARIQRRNVFIELRISYNVAGRPRPRAVHASNDWCAPRELTARNARKSGSRGGREIRSDGGPRAPRTWGGSARAVPRLVVQERRVGGFGGRRARTSGCRADGAAAHRRADSGPEDGGGCRRIHAAARQGNRGEGAAG